jgi:hypothetical protein
VLLLPARLRRRHLPKQTFTNFGREDGDWGRAARSVGRPRRGSTSL